LGPPGGPVAQIALHRRDRSLVAILHGGGIRGRKAIKLALDRYKPFRCDEIRMHGHRPVRQFDRVGVGFLDEGAAHGWRRVRVVKRGILHRLHLGAPGG